MIETSQFLQIPYVFGRDDLAGADCLGLALVVARSRGFTIPNPQRQRNEANTAEAWWRNWDEVVTEAPDTLKDTTKVGDVLVAVPTRPALGRGVGTIVADGLVLTTGPLTGAIVISVDRFLAPGLCGHYRARGELLPASPVRGASVHYLSDVFARSRTTRPVIVNGRSISQTIADTWPERWPDNGLPLVVVRNGEVLEDLTRLVAEGDHIAVFPRMDAVGSGVAFANTLLFSIAVSIGANYLLAGDAPELSRNEGLRTNVQRWDGIHTEYLGDSAPIAVGYGRHHFGGTVITYVVRNRGIRSILYLLVVVSQGPGRGLLGVNADMDNVPGGQIEEGMLELAGNDVRSWGNKVHVWTRIGRINQTPIPGMNDQDQVFPVGVKLQPKKPQEYTSRLRVHALQLRIEFIRGLIAYDKKGKAHEEQVAFRYRIRENVGGATWGPYKRFEVRKKVPTGFDISREVVLPYRAKWKIELTHLTPATPGQTTQTATKFLDVTETIYRDFENPDLMMVGLRITGSEGLEGTQPQIRGLGDFRIVPIWDEVSTSAPVYVDTWTENPVWCALDVVRNTRYGMGGSFRLLEIDIQEWQDAADACDVLAYAFVEADVDTATSIGDSVMYLTDTSGFSEDDQVYVDKDNANEELLTIGEVFADRVRFKSATTIDHAAGEKVQKYEKRYVYGNLIDSDNQSGWDLAQRILQTCRCRLSKEGNRLRVIQDVARSAVMLLSESNVDLQFAMEYKAKGRLPNVLVIQFMNADKASQRDSVRVTAEDANLDELGDSTFYSREVPFEKVVTAWGITRASQARRHGIWRLRKLRLTRRRFNLGASMQAIAARDGDVVDVAHRIVQTEVFSGSVIEAVASGSTVKLSREVVLAVATTYAIEVRVDPGGGDKPYLSTKTVTTAAGTYARGTAISISPATWPDPIAKDAPFALGVQGAVTTAVEIVEKSLGRGLRVKMKGALYVEAALADT